MRFGRVTGVLLLAALISPAAALAQTSMGGVNGTVTDASGSVLPGATVTLVNAATDVRAVRVTNEAGHFTFVNVRPGSYTLSVELEGFARAEVSPFTVGVNETLARGVMLQIGQLTETTTVTAQSELLQSTTAELGNVVEEKVIRQLPTQGRNFTQLLLLSPGVAPVSRGQG